MLPEMLHGLQNATAAGKGKDSEGSDPHLLNRHDNAL